MVVWLMYSNGWFTPASKPHSLTYLGDLGSHDHLPTIIPNWLSYFSEGLKPPTIYIYTCSIVMLNYQRVSDITIWYDCELATFQAASCPSCETMWNTATCLPPRWVRTVCWRRPNTPRGRPTWRRTDPSHPDGAEWCWVFSMIPSFFWEIWNQNPIYQAKNWVSRTCYCKSILIYILYIYIYMYPAVQYCIKTHIL